jgi:hypothetical protein
MINPASGFWPNCGPVGGPREPCDGLRLEKRCRLHQKSAPETNYKSRSWVLCVSGAGRTSLGVDTPAPLPKAHKKGGGGKPPPFPECFQEGNGRLDSKNRRSTVLDLSVANQPSTPLLSQFF